MTCLCRPSAGQRPLSPPRAMDNSPTSLFDSYENEFTQFIDTINDKLEEASKDGDAGA